MSMTSKNLRGFSAGIILSTGILAGFYYTADDAGKTSELTEESVAQYLSEKGELAISKEEYTSLKDTETAAAPVAKEEPKTEKRRRS
ncbi:unnamed protein product [marine sediment metagenome]|uniref:Uncharacterized protein n=1 Tax=marine sediment metagenome TaxID=412755 RepID=X1N283_9ZZZZ